LEHAPNDAASLPGIGNQGGSMNVTSRPLNVTTGRESVDPRVRAAVERFQKESRSIRLAWRDRLRYWLYYLGLAHFGRMVYSPKRDSQYEDGFYKRGYDKYCNKLNDALIRSGQGQPVPVEVPSFDHGSVTMADLKYLMSQQIPFGIRGGAAMLPARNWTLDYLERVAGTCTVPINEADDRPSPDKSVPTKAHNYYAFRTGTLAEVITSIRTGGKMRATTAEDVMHHAGSQLRSDLNLPYWEKLSGWERNKRHWLRSRLFAGKVVGAQLLVQPRNAFTLWHAESGDNFFVLATGHKTWWLADPYYTAAMRPRVKTTTNYHGSNIDMRESDDVQRARGFQGYLAIPKVVLRMQPGDMIRVPNHWWHSVMTDPGDYTVAAAIRVNSSINMTGLGYTILRLFDRQYRAMVRAYKIDGRLRDSDIGYPRRSRSMGGPAT
jgi:hypothetical protein